jgi:imidazolonepropionase
VIPPAPADGVQGYVTRFIEEILPVVDDEDLAEFCDVHCDARGLTLAQARAVLEAAGAMGLTPKVHADVDADAGGARLAAEVDAISADHLSAASGAGLAAMVDAGTIAVLLPATAGAARLPSSRPRRMIEMGLAVALGTDYGAAGAPTWSMLDVAVLACRRLEMLPAEALAATTINAAWAIGMAEEIGSLEPGKAADIITLNVGDHHTLASASAVPQVRLVIKRGRLVSG